MRKNRLTFLTIVAVLSLFSCSTASKTGQTKVADGHNSRNSLDWAGVYKGVLPCADCEGISTTVQLNKDGTYRIKSEYLGTQEGNNTFRDSGNFTWNAEGSTIELENSHKYFVGENRLTQLNQEGNKITGSLADHYVLTKLNGQIKETYWKLITINGNPVNVDSSFNKEPHFILKDKDNRIVGNAGCNNIMGNYKLMADNKISFSKIASTLMACPNLKIEDQFKKVLEATNHYNLMDDELTLLDGKTPLAQFKAVYF